MNGIIDLQICRSDDSLTARVAFDIDREGNVELDCDDYDLTPDECGRACEIALDHWHAVKADAASWMER